MNGPIHLTFPQMHNLMISLLPPSQVDPAQFLRVCERSHCGSVPGPIRGPCRLAAAFVHICQRNYVPLELPVQCFAL